MIKKKLTLIFLFLLVLPLISAGNYGVLRYSTGVYSVGEVVSTPITPPGSPGGGGPSCVYDWQCTNWFPAECPESKIQERICANKGTCTGTLGMPKQNRTCIYEDPTEPLFDIFLSIPKQYTEICAGRNLKANIKLENYGKLELLDAFMIYWIINQNNTLIAELKDTRAVKEKINFNAEIKIPELTPQGTYRLYAQITYSNNKTAVAGESFEIIEVLSCKLYYNIPQYILILFAGFTFFIIIVLIIRKIKKRIKERKETPHKIKEIKSTIKRKMKPKKEIVSQNEIKEITPKRKSIGQIKERKRPARKHFKSPETEQRLKKQMFKKLLDNTVKLKKETKKKK